MIQLDASLDPSFTARRDWKRIWNSVNNQLIKALLKHVSPVQALRIKTMCAVGLTGILHKWF